MGMMDVLRQYTTPAGAPDSLAAHAHFDEVVQSAPQEVLGQGVADAFRADSTPPFGEMVGNLFGQSDPQQRAGLLNQLIRSIDPGVLSALGGGILGRLGQSATGNAQVTPEQAARMTPAQVQEVAVHAEQHDPGIVDQVGDFYAGHPQMVKTLGSAALAIALAGVASRMRG